MGTDPLSAPSGFVSSGNYHHASLRRPWGGEGNQAEGRWEDGPPRKRMNLGPSYNVYDAAGSPPSPEIQRPGQKRRAATSIMESHSTSSDDSLPDVAKILAGPSKPRIMRGRPSSLEASPASDLATDPKFIRFKVTMPMEPPSRVQAAWLFAKGDVKKATELLSDRLWVPPQPPAVTKAERDAIGRVREIDEATKAQRVAVKEKGKKSMIYANRPVLEVKPPSISTPPAKRVFDIPTKAPATPETPMIAAPRRKRIKKMVVNSDSEAEFGESDEDDRENKRGRMDNTDDIRALEYFNTTAAAALQELTGKRNDFYPILPFYLSCPVGCTPDQANAIIKLRPFESIDDLNIRLGQGKKKAGPAGISPRMFEECQNIFEGYGAVDSILADCERIGATLRTAIATWTTEPATGKGKTNADFASLSTEDESEDGALSLVSLAIPQNQKPKDYLVTQPALLSKSVQLKDYQLLGVNWLNLLYRSSLSCILADEMGKCSSHPS